METHTIYARKIYYSKAFNWNKITNEIYLFCKSNKVDPFIFLAIFYIEEYFRPYWCQSLELVLLNLGILKNPSVGPLQVRKSNLDSMSKKNSGTILSSSLAYALLLYKKSNLHKDLSKKNFVSLGLYYNLDKEYGKVLYELYKLLKLNKWQKINAQ